MALEIRFASSRGIFMDRLHALGLFSLLEKQAYEHLETRKQLPCLNRMNKTYFLYFFLKKKAGRWYCCKRQLGKDGNEVCKNIIPNR